MKRHVLSWLTDQVPYARHALILTHNIDLLFVQSVLLPQLRRAGNPRITIYADAMCAAQNFAQQRALLEGLGVRYRVVPVDLGPYRRFHPKALLLTSPERAALAIGSGNLTHGGMGGNQEAWAFATSDGEGSSLIPAFRDYVEKLASTVPLSEALEDTTDAIFDPDQAWVASLPPPFGLAGSPSDTTILDQVAALITGNIRSVTVLAPYHDDDGEALSAIANRFGVPVTCWIQARRAGLSQSAASTLPANVSLRAVDCEDQPHPRFIHAKLLAFHRENDVVLAIGSANCSRAALLADRSWGNAELMAVDSVSTADAETFFSALVRGDGPPALPDTPASDDWERIARHPLRILAARQEGARLSVAYHAPEPLADVRLESDEGTWLPTSDSGTGELVFNLQSRLRVVRISGITKEGARIASPEGWVDDETSLSAPATLNRMLKRLRDDEQSDDPAETFRGVMELFGDYLRDPEAARRRVRREDGTAHPTGPYDPSIVFSDDFGMQGVSGHRDSSLRTYAQTNILTIIEALFAEPRSSSEGKPPPADGGPSDEDEDDPEGEEARLLARREHRPPNARTKAALARALTAAERALCDPKFVAARSPGLLGTDIAVAATLLVMGLTKDFLDATAYRDSTRRIWAALFFGDGREPGALPSRIEGIADATERERFVRELSNARLSAAMAIWSGTEWGATDANASWFRYSAAQLQERCPWLFTGAAPQSVALEMERMSASVLPPNELVAARNAWARLVRAGEALRLLRGSLIQADQADPTALRENVASTHIEPSELVWVGGHFGFTTASVRRDRKEKADVRFLGQAETRKFVAAFLVPVREVVTAEVLDLPSVAKAAILDLIDNIMR